MLQVDWKPDTAKLRQFGWICLAGFGLAGWVVLRKFDHRIGATICWSLAVVLPILGLLSTRLLRPVYVVMLALALPIGLVVSHIVLGILYYGVLTPLGLFFRLTGRDALRRRIEPDARSYWIESGKPRPPQSYYRQF